MPLLLIGIAIPIAIGALYVCYRRPDVGLGILLLGGTFFIAFGPNAAIVGGLHLTPSDVAAMLLLVAGAMRSFRAFHTLNLNRAVILGYLALMAFSVARGFLAHGLTTTGNESRMYVGPIASMLYFATVPTDEVWVRRYTWVYLCFGVLLCGVAVASAAGLPVGLVYWSAENVGIINGRYLPATGAAALAECGFLSLAILQYQSRGWLIRLLPILFIGGAVYLRHRTVWMMLLVGMAALLLVDFKMFRRLLPFAGVAVAAVVVVAVLNIGGQGQSSASQFEDAASNGQTLLWRVNGWAGLLFEDDQNALTVATGKSMGSGFWRVDPDTYEALNVAPHSEYIASYLRVGVLGVMLALLFAARPAVRLWHRAKTESPGIYPSTSVWCVVAIIALVFGLTYAIDPHLYALLGIANAMAMNAQPAEEMLPGSEDEWTTDGLDHAMSEGA